MSDEIRRSSRANKGTHSGRDTHEVYYRPEAEEPEPKRAKTSDTDHDAIIEDAADDPADGDEGKVRCDPCGTTEENYDEESDKGGTMIECDLCNTWQHARCMGFRRQREIPNEYMCNRCQPKDEPYEHSELGPSKSAREARKTERQPAKKALKGKALVEHNTRNSVKNALVKVLVKTDGTIDAEPKAEEIEAAVHKWAGSTDKKYIDKSRSVMALVKKPLVLQRLISGDLPTSDLVLLPVEELDPDLKNYAEKVRQELIRRLVLTVEDALSQRIRRTHKGEEIVETNAAPYEEETVVVRRPEPEKAEKPPSRENTPVEQAVPALYQLGDDDDEYAEGTKAEDNDGGNDGASDDELDFILAQKPQVEPKEEPKKREVPKKTILKSEPRLPPTMPTKFWLGEVVFPDFASFHTDAEFISCTKYEKPRDNTTASFHNRVMRVCKELLEKNAYYIEGRLDRAKADAYLSKVTTSRDFYVVQLSSQDAEPYEKVYSYLLKRNKVGVLSNRPAFVKDAYVFALDGDMPPYLSFAPITRGLFVLFVAQKSYVPVGKSILKKAAPVPAPVPANLDSILSKLEPTHSMPNLPQKPVNYSNQAHGGYEQPYAPQVNQLSADQMSYLSELVQHNPQVQNNPQALLDLLQNMR